MQNHLMGIKAIMQLFRVGKRTVLQWQKDGAPIVKIGRAWQANYFDLWSWLKARAKDPA